MKLIDCPSCPVKLQPLEPTSTYVDSAMARMRQARLGLPAHGPAATVVLALVAHAQVCHPTLNLASYLKAAGW